MASETPQQKIAREAGEHTMVLVERAMDPFGSPMVRISVAAAELVPTVQYGNATIGPVVVDRFITDGDDDHILGALRSTVKLVEQVVAEERMTLQQQIQARLAGK